MAKSSRPNGSKPPNGDDHLPPAETPVFVQVPEEQTKLQPWLPGQAGTPPRFRFWPGEYNKVRKICAEASEEAARIQIKLMRDHDPRIQLIATEAVLNRGIGKPRDHSDEDRKQRSIDLSGLTNDELKSLGELLKKALGVEG
jgi:hypothetical protein